MADYTVARKRPTQTDASDETFNITVNGTEKAITADGTTHNTLTQAQFEALNSTRWTVTAV